MKIEIFPDVEQLSRAAADKFVESANAAIKTNNRFTVALAGGSTPKSLYKLLAGAEYRGKIDWTKTYFFWGDERCVPADSDESNFKTANDNLLKPLDISASNCFRFQTESAPDAAALDYDKTLRDFFALKSGELPRFDLILLGMGADGHTASIFPDSKVVRETTKLVAAPYVEKFQTFRLTLTPPVLNNAAQVIFLVAGADKSQALKTILQGADSPDKFPASLVQPTNGKLLWLVDQTSTSSLKK